MSIDGKGAELSLSRFRAGPCDWSLYATGYILKNDGRADDHFFPTSKNVNGVATDMSGYAAGLSCNNLKNSNFRIGVQASRQKFDEPWVIGNGKGEGPYENMSAIMLVFGGKFGARVSK